MGLLILESAFGVFLVCAVVMMVVMALPIKPGIKIWVLRLIGFSAMAAIIGGVLFAFGAEPLPLLGCSFAAIVFCVQLFRLIVCDQCGYPLFRDHDINDPALHRKDCPFAQGLESQSVPRATKNDSTSM